MPVLRREKSGIKMRALTTLEMFKRPWEMFRFFIVHCRRWKRPAISHIAHGTGQTPVSSAVQSGYAAAM